MPQRLSINISRETDVVLRRYADKHGITVTEAIRRWASLVDLLERETEAGSEVLFRREGAIREVILL